MPYGANPIDGSGLQMMLATAVLSLQSIAGHTLAPPLDTLVDAGGYRMHVMVYRGTARRGRRIQARHPRETTGYDRRRSGVAGRRKALTKLTRERMTPIVLTMEVA